MRRRLALLLPLLIAGCHRAPDGLAKLDVPSPAPAYGWVQFRHGPGGYAFQAPRTWALRPDADTTAILTHGGADRGLVLRNARSLSL